MCGNRKNPEHASKAAIPLAHHLPCSPQGKRQQHFLSSPFHTETSVCVYVVHSFAKEEDFQNILMRLIQIYSIRSESFLESDAIPQCHISLSLIRDVCSFRHHPSSSRQAVGLPWPQRTHSWGEDGGGGCLRGLSVNGRRWKAMLAPSVHCQLSTIEFPIALTVECEIVLLIHMPCLRHSHTHWWKWKADTMHCGVFLKVNATHPKYVTFLGY